MLSGHFNFSFERRPLSESMAEFKKRRRTSRAYILCMCKICGVVVKSVVCLNMWHFFKWKISQTHVPCESYLRMAKSSSIRNERIQCQQTDRKTRIRDADIRRSEMMRWFARWLVDSVVAIRIVVWTNCLHNLEYTKIAWKLIIHERFWAYLSPCM